ncbi:MULTISPECIES: ATP-binding cassette domain-containing protein [Dysgonomonas]|uniref:ATP-binding cassette domain-containing protein n=1 Tax=Dysgonomonas capnocytophagoides TaxID=45254 RepID=A0A4Y8L3K8_9BACT|nr:ATP-binding cassette domain-containing protein [Dysgonomonas sp.]TFD96841.1 ATP-binding cassette domain-containing protein [Dysgonomonas capnocytophagoides]
MIRPDYELNGINLSISENKVTAIVGTSGSGKTTLIKTAFSFLSAQQGVNQNKRYSA